ncbi:MAG: hypothetical protein ACXWN0_11055, partial [Isosphaeraceae bacterium]
RFQVKRRIISLTVLAPLIVFAADNKVPRLADGHPDLSGIWTNVSITPLERPRVLAAKEFFTPEEAAQYEKTHIRNRDNRT